MDISLIKAALGSIVRHGGTLLAGWLLARGYIDEGAAQEVVGLVTAAAVVAWSILQKRWAARA